MKLYLHIGHHKTATTSLQLFFNENRKTFEQLNFCYPKTGCVINQGAHHHLVSAVRLPHHPYFKPEKSFEEYVNDLEVEIAPYENALISTEILCEAHLDYNKLLLLKNIAEDIKVIFYIRRQDLYIESRYSTYVFYGERKKFKNIIENVELDFSIICDKWAKLIGKENVIVRPFESCQFIGGNIYSDFLNVCGLPVQNFNIPTNRSNISFNRSTLEFKRLVNIIWDDHMKINKALMELSKKDFERTKKSGNSFLSFAERRDLLNNYSESNKYIAKEYLNGDNAVLFKNKLDNTESTISTVNLNDDTKVEIGNFLYNFDKILYNQLASVIKNSIHSDRNLIRETGEVLLPAIIKPL